MRMRSSNHIGTLLQRVAEMYVFHIFRTHEAFLFKFREQIFQIIVNAFKIHEQDWFPAFADHVAGCDAENFVQCAYAAGQGNENIGNADHFRFSFGKVVDEDHVVYVGIQQPAFLYKRRHDGGDFRACLFGGMGTGFHQPFFAAAVNKSVRVFPDPRAKCFGCGVTTAVQVVAR